jgi:hypothetical protein
MRPISNTTGSNSTGSTPGEAGDPTDAYTRKDHYQELIDRANTVPLTRIFKLYGIRLDEQNRKTTCPFKFHKGGRESTPSFCYYAGTNSFRCFGCGTGGKSFHGCEFMAAYENMTKVDAAHKILQLFSEDVDVDNIYDRENLSERLEIMLDFSNVVREFRQTFLDEKSQEFIEFICEVYDQHNTKRNLDNEALRRMVEQIKEKISSYTL